MIDLHCHLDLFDDPYELVAEIAERQCYVLAVTTTPLAWEGTNRVVADATRIRVALGLHPELVAQRYKEIRQFELLLPEAQYVGEIGLDGSDRHRSSFKLQVEIFRAILRMTARAGGRIMSIHSRAAATTVLDELERHQGTSTAILHWFTGTLSELQRACDLNCWFSVGPAMVRTREGRRLVAAMPRERVLTESDGPFTREYGAPIVPWNLGRAVQVLGEIWGLTELQVQRQLRTNLKTLLRTSPSASQRV